jgi:hypothetical protein
MRFHENASFLFRRAGYPARRQARRGVAVLFFSLEGDTALFRLPSGFSAVNAGCSDFSCGRQSVVWAAVLIFSIYCYY